MLKNGQEMISSRALNREWHLGMEKVQVCLGSREAVPGISTYGSGSDKTPHDGERRVPGGELCEFLQADPDEPSSGRSFVLQRTMSAEEKGDLDCCAKPIHLISVGLSWIC